MFLDPDLTEYIHLKAMLGDHFTVETLLKEDPAKAHATNGRLVATPLLYASRHGHTKVCEVLLSHEADVHFNVNGWTALHEAAFGNRKDVANLLLHHGANPNVRVSYSGVTPLMQAARWGFHDMCESLLHAGADAWLRNVDGKMAVDLAGSGNCREILDRRMKLEVIKQSRQESWRCLSHECATCPVNIMHQLPDELFHRVLEYI